jgi:transcriptional regulator with XRE-family HTH domain
MSDLQFSELVKKVRKQLGLSQEDLAHKLGVSFATINRWENSKTMPSKLARSQFDSLYKEMQEEGKLMMRDEL